jgi:parvulin-like peptidyl-prolyl isomerase
MNSERTRPVRLWAVLAAASLALAGCGPAQLTPAPPAPTASVSPAAASATPAAPPLTPTLPPSPTPEPLAATVNGEAIRLAQYQSELERYRAAQGAELAPADRQRVLDELIDQLLLAQAAVEAGYQLDEAVLQTRLEALTAQVGGPDKLAQWLADNGYSQDDFRAELTQAAAAAWMRDRLAAQVPAAAEQVRARQILYYEAAAAEAALAGLQRGADFAELMAASDAGGDLGWIPRAELIDAGLEQAVFALQPGEYTAIIQSSAGYHIVQVSEREAARPLTPEQRYRLQLQAISEWIAARRSQAEIRILVS